MKKYIFLTLLFFFVLIPFFVFSQEVVYPSIPGFTPPQEFLKDVQSQEEILPLFMQYFFGLFLVISVAVAFLVTLYGGVIYILSSGNPEKRKSGKSWILGAMQGTLIIFASYALLYTLDSQLVLFQQRPLGERPLERRIDLEWEIKNVYYQIPFGLLVEDAILNTTAQSKLYDVLDATNKAEDTSVAIEEGSKQLLEIIEKCPENEPCLGDDGDVNAPPTRKQQTPRKERKAPSWVTELFTPSGAPDLARTHLSENQQKPEKITMDLRDTSAILPYIVTYEQKEGIRKLVNALEKQLTTDLNIPRSEREEIQKIINELKKIIGDELISSTSFIDQARKLRDRLEQIYRTDKIGGNTLRHLKSLIDSLPKGKWGHNDIPYIYQKDPRWTRDKYAGGTIGGSACIPATASMPIAYFANQNVETVFKDLLSVATNENLTLSTALFARAAEKYKVGYELRHAKTLANFTKEIQDATKKDSIISLTGRDIPYNSPGATSGHALLIVDTIVRNNKIYAIVIDSNDPFKSIVPLNDLYRNRNSDNLHVFSKRSSSLLSPFFGLISFEKPIAFSPLFLIIVSLVIFFSFLFGKNIFLKKNFFSSKIRAFRDSYSTSFVSLVLIVALISASVPLNYYSNNSDNEETFAEVIASGENRAEETGKKGYWEVVGENLRSWRGAAVFTAWGLAGGLGIAALMAVSTPVGFLAGVAIGTAALLIQSAIDYRAQDPIVKTEEEKRNEENLQDQPSPAQEQPPHKDIKNCRGYARDKCLSTETALFKDYFSGFYCCIPTEEVAEVCDPPCEEGYKCVDGECVKEEVCDPPCEEGYKCVDGECVKEEEEKECEPGEKQCEGDVVMVCTNEGAWEESEDCKDKGEMWICEEGKCVMTEPCPACPDIAPAVQSKITEIEGHMAQLAKDLDALLLTKEPIKEDLYQLYKVAMLKSLGYTNVFGYNSLLLERRYYEREEVVIDTDREVSQIGKYSWDWSRWINNILYRREIGGRVVEKNDPVTFYLRMPLSRRIVEDALRLSKEAKARDIQTIKNPLRQEPTTSLNVFQRAFSLVTGMFSNTILKATLTPAHTPGEFVTCGMEIPVGEVFELTWIHLIELLDTIDKYVAEGRKLIEQQAKMNELARRCDCPCEGGKVDQCGACKLTCDLNAIKAAHQEVLKTREKMKEIATHIELLTHGHFNTPTENVCDPLNEDIRNDQEKILCKGGGSKMITKHELITRKLNYSRHSFDECITRPEHLEDVLAGRRAGRLPFFGPFVERTNMPRYTKTRRGNIFVNTSDFNWFCCFDSETR